MTTPAEQAVEKPNPQAPLDKLLGELVKLHADKELQSLVVGYIKKDGGAMIQSTPMSPVMMNHLSTLLERRVAREYDRALAQAAGPARGGTGAGAVPETAHSNPIAKLPRKVRRQVEKAQRMLVQSAGKKQPLEPIIRRPRP